MFKLVVLSSVLALVATKPSAVLPLGYHFAAPLVGPVVAAHTAIAAAPVVAAAPLVAAAPVLGAHNYRGPLSLAPGQPANILAVDGRPLDTLSVNIDRAAHYTAKAVDHAGAHLLGKRSAPLLAPGLAWSHASRIDWPTTRLTAPLHLAVAAAPLGLGHVGHLAQHW